MTGMPFNFLRLGYTEIGDEYYNIEYENSTNIFGVGDIPPHRHIEPTFFDDDFFEQRSKVDTEGFEKLMQNYSIYLHFTGSRWYGKFRDCFFVQYDVLELHLTQTLFVIQGIYPYQK